MSEKKFCGAPFGIQLGRFQVTGTHPRRRPPGSLTQVSYDEKSMHPLNRKLGPGMYNFDNGAFTEKNVSDRASGPGWNRAYETCQASKLPHLLYRAEWEKKELHKCLLGPNSYSLPDSFKELSTKPRSIRGACETKAQRFVDVPNEVPGPGTYGKGGIPAAALEEKEQKSTSKIGSFDAASSGQRQLPEVGSSLCPGQYNSKSFTDLLANRKVSKRGPYDLFTGDRNKPIRIGHLAAPSKSKLGPGEYKAESFSEELNNEHKGRKGKFSQVDRTPEMPADRLHCNTLSQWPRKKDEPGPGSYVLPEVKKPEATKRPPFGSSADRTDKKATQFFLGSFSSVGPGRYNIRDWHEKQHKNGHKSAFDSKSVRYDCVRDKYLGERIRSRDVPNAALLIPNEA